MCRLRIGTLDAPTEFHGQTWKLISKFDFLCQALSSGYKAHGGVPRRAQKEGNIYLGAEGTDKRERVCRGWGTACIKPWRDRQNMCVWGNKRLGWRRQSARDSVWRWGGGQPGVQLEGFALGERCRLDSKSQRKLGNKEGATVIRRVICALLHLQGGKLGLFILALCLSFHSPRLGPESCQVPGFENKLPHWG